MKKNVVNISCSLFNRMLQESLREVILERRSVLGEGDFEVIPSGSIFYHGDNQVLPLDKREFFYITDDINNAIWYAGDCVSNGGGKGVIYHIRVKCDMICPSDEFLMNYAMEHDVIEDGEYDSLLDAINEVGVDELEFYDELYDMNSFPEGEFDVLPNAGSEWYVTKRGMSKLEIVNIEEL